MSSATQTSDLTETPAAGIWDIDPSHTTVEFIGRHLVFTKVRGRFTDVAGQVTISEDPTASSVEVTLNSSSINTGHDDRDGHLKSSRLLRRREPSGHHLQEHQGRVERPARAPSPATSR